MRAFAVLISLALVSCSSAPPQVDQFNSPYTRVESYYTGCMDGLTYQLFTQTDCASPTRNCPEEADSICKPQARVFENLVHDQNEKGKP